jgi:C4-dicarboxylate-specific signal transduction histidine kinase
MKLGEETFELDLITKALRTISKEISYEGLAEALLEAALDYSGAARGAVLLSEGGELVAKAHASFPRERARILVSRPPLDEFRLPGELDERVLTRQETVLSREGRRGFILTDPAERQTSRDVVFLCLPLVHQQRTVGVLYLEAEAEPEIVTPKRFAAMSLLASQAAVSFESAQLFEALRETNMWMIRGQRIGRMGSYRWNTRTLLSRASRECYRILDIDPDINPVPFEVFEDRVHPDDLPALAQALAKAVSARALFNHEYRVVHKDGKTLNVVAVGEFDVGPSGDVELEGIITDVTERKIAEQALTDARVELARAARLASLGEFAGSIIHEVSQPLTGIVASAEACLRWLARDPVGIVDARKSATRIIDLAHRTTAVVCGLRSLAREGQLRLAHVQLHEAVDEILLLLKGELERACITVKTDFDHSIPPIEADRVQVQQVVLNLARNAIEAMGDVAGRPRVLTIASRLSEGEVHLAFADTGVGIDPSMGERLFDVLHTTKRGGLGLGLSICQKIISAHGGRIWAERNVSFGAKFTFAIPTRQSAHRSESN